jgi:hypothetical protein
MQARRGFYYLALQPEPRLGNEQILGREIRAPWQGRSRGPGGWRRGGIADCGADSYVVGPSNQPFDFPQNFFLHSSDNGRFHTITSALSVG